MERFIKEYANYQKKYMSNNELMLDKIKDRAIKKIDRALQARERGLITVNETMKLIMECFVD